MVHMYIMMWNVNCGRIRWLWPIFHGWMNLETWPFASDLPLCCSYCSLKMWSYHCETWYTCTSWYKILDLQARLWFWPKSAERDISVIETHFLVSKFSFNMLWCERVRRNQSGVNLCKCTCTAHIISTNLNFIATITRPSHDFRLLMFVIKGYIGKRNCIVFI